MAHTGTNTLAGEVLAWLVWAVHVAVVVFFIWAPFSNSTEAQILAAFALPCIFLHWTIGADKGGDVCCLSVLESWLRGIPREHSFMHGLVAPIYTLPPGQAGNLTWAAALTLWGVAVGRFVQEPSKLTAFTRNVTHSLTA